MRVTTSFILLGVILAWGFLATGQALKSQEPEQPPKEKTELDPQAREDLGRAAVSILNRHCARCHGDVKVADLALDVHDAASMEPYIDRNSPLDSYLWEVIKDDYMPRGKQKLSAKEKETILEWLDNGAEFIAIKERGMVTEQAVLQAILGDMTTLRTSDPDSLLFVRYLSLAHLYNNPRIASWELDLYRAAVSKAVNSLSRTNQDIVIPKALDANGTVFRIDIRDYGWDRADWQVIVKGQLADVDNNVAEIPAYPYGVSYSNTNLENLRTAIGGTFPVRAQTTFPYVRADWFVDQIVRPPLYHRLLDIPEQESDLEQALGVNATQNIQSGQGGKDIARAGFSESVPSVSNRVVERHRMQGRQGSYWKSYDFARSSGEGNIFRRPLGPNFDGTPFSEIFRFSHDGGESIFSLPNGLQGYLIVNTEGQRIDKAPVSVVRDPDEISGTPEVTNGISCISCHNQGIKRFDDAVLAGFRGGDPDALAAVQRLFIPREAMGKLLDEDTERFKRSLELACGPLLQVGENQGRDIFSFDEPVRALIERYNKDLTPLDVLSELHNPETDADKPRINLQALKFLVGSNQLRELGLGPLAKDRTIKREVWHSTDGGFTQFQNAAIALQVATQGVK